VNRFDARVLGVFVAAPTRRFYITQVNQALGRHRLAFPWLYPPLARLERQGRIRSGPSPAWHQRYRYWLAPP
jgi:hypothetical protein